MLTPALSDRLLLTFGTLLLREQVTDLLPHHAELVRVAHAMRAAGEGLDRSNAGGFHSAGNIFARPEPAIGALANLLQPRIRYLCASSEGLTGGRIDLQVSLFGWLNVNTAGDWNTPHHHPGNTWSGVYYVQVGQPVPDRPQSGCIELVDPRGRVDVAARQGFSHAGSVVITPQDGMLLMFPSYLQHFVHPYAGPGERITLAFNALVHGMKVEA